MGFYVGFFFSGTAATIKGQILGFNTLPPSKTEVEKSKIQPLIHALIGHYAATSVNSQTLQGCWSVMP